MIFIASSSEHGRVGELIYISAFLRRCLDRSDYDVVRNLIVELAAPYMAAMFIEEVEIDGFAVAQAGSQAEAVAAREAAFSPVPVMAFDIVPFARQGWGKLFDLPIHVDPLSDGL
tara:strand:+ start:79 stop:423 length:345 start_codon:yes stop_codon:yes gene_type:complete